MQMKKNMILLYQFKIKKSWEIMAFVCEGVSTELES
jgi:hypothetical protein